jgi:hypothetical protein
MQPKPAPAVDIDVYAPTSKARYTVPDANLSAKQPGAVGALGFLRIIKGFAGNCSVNFA